MRKWIEHYAASFLLLAAIGVALLVRFSGIRAGRSKQRVVDLKKRRSELKTEAEKARKGLAGAERRLAKERKRHEKLVRDLEDESKKPDPKPGGRRDALRDEWNAGRDAPESD